MITGFVGHGAPTMAIDATRGAGLAAWGRAIPAPRAILVVSAHWLADRATLGATSTRELIYDFSGFPDELYRVRYAAPGAPDLAARVTSLLAPAPVPHTERGLDHGTWVPLVHMVPHADVPVLQLAIPARASGAELFALGRALAPLRDEGVLILGSGNVTHNLRRVDFSEQSAPPAWASEFDQWCAGVVERRDFDALMDFRARAPALAMAHPTDEHFVPLVIAAGAASAGDVTPSFPVQGFEYGSLSRRCVQFG